MIDAPTDLTPDEQVTFDEIIEELPAETWTPHLVKIAAILAKEMTAQVADMTDARSEGTLQYFENGNPKQNPRRSAIAQRTAIICRLRRSLRIDGRSIHGEIREFGRRNAIRKGQEVAVRPVRRDNLIKFPQGDPS